MRHTGDVLARWVLTGNALRSRVNVEEAINAIVRYFVADPMRLVALVGGSGGVVYWFDRIRSRPKVNIRVLSVSDGFIEFETENLSLDPNSLRPTIHIEGWSPLRRFHRYAGDIAVSDRSLPPLSPKRFRARVRSSNSDDDQLPFLYFASLIVAPTRGRRKKVKYRSLARMEKVGFLGVAHEVVFLIVGKVRIHRAWLSLRRLPVGSAATKSPGDVYSCKSCGEWHDVPHPLPNDRAAKVFGYRLSCPMNGCEELYRASDFKRTAQSRELEG